MRTSIRAATAAAIFAGLASFTALAGDDSDNWGLHFGLGVHGSGNIKTESRDVGSFDRVQSRGSIDVEIAVGKQASVTVEADDNILSLIRTDVRGGALIIDSQSNFSSRHSPLVHITTPSLQALQVSGSGDSDIAGASGDQLLIRIEGSGDVRASGSVKSLRLRIEGSGDARLGDLNTDQADVEIDGSGDADLAVASSLDATVNGSGDVHYSGNPAHVTTRVHGSGEIERHSGS
jgi:hypothetical protein